MITVTYLALYLCRGVCVLYVWVCVSTRRPEEDIRCLALSIIFPWERDSHRIWRDTDSQQTWVIPHPFPNNTGVLGMSQRTPHPTGAGIYLRSSWLPSSALSSLKSRAVCGFLSFVLRLRAAFDWQMDSRRSLLRCPRGQHPSSVKSGGSCIWGLTERRDRFLLPQYTGMSTELW